MSDQRFNEYEVARLALVCERTGEKPHTLSKAAARSYLSLFYSIPAAKRNDIGQCEVTAQLILSMLSTISVREFLVLRDDEFNDPGVSLIPLLNRISEKTADLLKMYGGDQK